MSFERARRSPLLSTLAGWPRRVLAALCLLAAGATFFLAPAAGRARPALDADAVPVVVAARALAAGRVLAADDLRLTQWPRAIAPTNRLADPNAAVGRAVGAAMARGEPFTTSRLLDTAIAAALGPSEVAVTVTLRESAAASIIQPGALIDLYGTEASSVLADGGSISTTRPDASSRASPSPLISAARVLAVLPTESAGAPPSSADGSTGPAPVVVLAVNHAVVGRLAGQSVDTMLATLRPAQ
jgi:pilus assembly protein CpaB